MSERLAIVSGSDLAVFQGTLPGGAEVRTFAEAPAAEAWAPGAVIALGPQAAAVGPVGIGEGAVTAAAGVLRPGTGAAAVAVTAASPRTVATAGTGLWRQGPWPVPDDLFGLPAPPAGAPVLVACGTEADRHELLRELSVRGLAAAEAPEPDRAALSAASTVLLAGAPQAPLHPAAPAVLAAGRMLVAPRADPGFGLEPGIDHLAYEHPMVAAEWADAVTRDPPAFESLRAFGRVTAERHRASVVYERWLTDLRLTAPPPPPPPPA